MTSPAHLADLLTSSRPDVPTRKALLVLDLQNDFALNGKLPLTWADGFANLASPVAAARATGLVVWVRSEHRHLLPFDPNGSLAGADPIIQNPNRPPDPSLDHHHDDDSEDEFLRNAMSASSLSAGASELMKRVAAKSAASSLPPPRDLFMSQPGSGISQQCCVPGTAGSQWIPDLDHLIDERKDLLLVKNTYSAFTSTNLLQLLRSKLVTELYICGALTNVSVYSTAAAAVSHGMHVTLIEDCLGYYDADAHEEAIAQMSYYMGAAVILSTDFPPPPPHALKKRPSQLLHPAPQAAVTRLDTSIHPQPASRSPSRLVSSPMSAQKASRIPRRSSGNTFSTLPRSASRASSAGGRDSPAAFARHTSRTQAISPVSAGSEEPAESSAPALPTLDHSSKETVSSSDPDLLEVARPISPLPTPPDEPPAVALAPSHSDPVQHTLPVRSRSEVIEPLIPEIDVAKLERTERGQLIGDGDSELILGSFDDLVAGDAFAAIKNEVPWQKMYHASGQVPRLVCAQGIIAEDGSMPVYRHPSDHSLPLMHYSPLIDAIRRRVEQAIGHPLNHALIQLYRSGQDFISEHSDKTLDIVRGSYIVNASIGAQRTMRLRAKRQGSRKSDEETETHQGQPREAINVPLPHGSLFLLGPRDNARYLHGIRANKRPESEKLEEERLHGGERISLTFRYIGTFLDADSRLIWGQGATRKAQVNAQPTINGDAAETERIINAFGAENQSTEFDWRQHYGDGSNVLHFQESEEEVPMLFPSLRTEETLAVRILLGELGLRHVVGGVSPADAGADYTPRIFFRDTDTTKTQTIGFEAVLVYLDRFYSSPSRHVDIESLRLLFELPRLRRARPWRLLEAVQSQLLLSLQRDGQEDEHEVYLGGWRFSLADAAYWPVVDEVVEEYHDLADHFPLVDRWHARVSRRDSVAQVLWQDVEG